MKEQLIQLINSFAAARATNDPLLQQFASQQLSSFLEKVEVVEKEQPSEETEI